MPITQQQLHSIKIHSLKNLVDLEMSFDGLPVTAILGPNGNGKSTVLHALACAFQPVSDGENYKFSSFFLPNTDALWQGSHLEIVHSYRENQTIHENKISEYTKNSDRWTPKYARRPSRDIYYIGIDKCVPLIESENKATRINYSTENVGEQVVLDILKKASYILNRQYSAFNIHKASGKKFIGVESNNLKYSALSMSAGEQKVFYILEKVFRAKKNSLILIDEIDLLLHDGAMKRLIEVAHTRASEKKLQIVATTHRESILDQDHLLNVRHIVVKSGKSLCFNETKPDAINRLTGIQPRPLEVFVEDDLGAAVIKKLAGQLKGAKYVSVQRYGAAINCFTTVGGLLLGGESCDRSLFVIDGDVYRTDKEKQDRINKILTGDDQQSVDYRTSALEKISQFVIPEGFNPERYLHSIIIEMDNTDNDEYAEIIECAKEIQAVNDDHKYIEDLIDRLDWERGVGLAKVIDLVAISEQWDAYILDIKEWMRQQLEAVIEVQPNIPDA
jgi:energy-coupling factor transporter ATP-binding protein EcfA2